MIRRSRGSGASRALRLALALVAAMALCVAVTGPILAAGTEWGTPSASSQYGVAVDFTQPVTLPTDTSRVEMLLTVPGVDGPFVTEVVPEALGRPTTLDFTYDAAASYVYPNTRFEGRWRVTRADGSQEVGPARSVTYEDTSHDWRTRTGEVVRLHWYEGDDRFAEQALEVGEAGLRKATEFLGVSESDPVDFFIYASRDDFMQAFGSGSYEWAGAFALPETRTLIADIPPDEIDTELVGLYVPHELAHVVFDTATANPYHEPPRWLNEGLAVYLTEGNAPNWRRSVRDGVADGRLLPLGAIAYVFPTSADGADLAYGEGVSAVSHMVDTYGKEALVRLVRAYADGVSDDEAFTRGLGVTLAEFESGWLASLDAGMPERQGPLPAPPGPMPSAWLAASPPPGAATAEPAASPTTIASGPTPAATPLPSAGVSGGGPADGPSGVPLLLVTVASVVGVAVVTIIFFARRARRREPPTHPGWAGSRAAGDVATSPGASRDHEGTESGGPSADEAASAPSATHAASRVPAYGPPPIVWGPAEGPAPEARPGTEAVAADGPAVQEVPPASSVLEPPDAPAADPEGSVMHDDGPS